MPTLRECHIKIVRELEARGETVYNPCASSMMTLSDGIPKVYVKGREFQTPEFLCGTAIREKDGTISILPEPMADLRGIGGFKIEDLGLCDPICYYRNSDKKPSQDKPAPETVMPVCANCQIVNRMRALLKEVA